MELGPGTSSISNHIVVKEISLESWFNLKQGQFTFCKCNSSTEESILVPSMEGYIWCRGKLPTWGHCFGEGDILYGSKKGAFLQDNNAIIRTMFTTATNISAIINMSNLCVHRNGENVRKSPPSKKTKKTNLDFPSESPSYRCALHVQSFHAFTTFDCFNMYATTSHRKDMGD